MSTITLYDWLVTLRQGHLTYVLVLGMTAGIIAVWLAAGSWLFTDGRWRLLRWPLTLATGWIVLVTLTSCWVLAGRLP